MPAVLAAALALAGVETFDIVLFQVLMIPLFFSVILIFVTVVPATALIRDEIDDNTMPFLLTRPVSKPTIAGSKYFGYLAVALVLLLPPLVVAYAITETYAGVPLSADLDVLGAFLLATVLGAAAYGAFFTFLSVLLRRPLAVGLLIGFLWESVVGSLPGDVPKLSVIHYLRSIMKDLIPVGPLSAYPTDISAPVGIAVLIAFSIASLLLAMALFQAMEFKQKA